MNGAGIAGIFGFILSILVTFLILSAIIRYSIDSSRSAREIKELVHELRMLRKEIKEIKDINKEIKENKHIIDTRI